MLNLGGPRQRAVFALLLIARGSVVTGDRLIDSLWDGALPPGAVGTLHAYVSRLRRLFEPDRAAGARQGVIVTEGSGYALRIDENDKDAVDAWRFERLLEQATAATNAGEAVTVLSRALGLWRGPAAFAEFAEERWARPEADRLAELREVARERLLAARLDRGESAVLIPDAEALVAEQPLREERWRLLALALYRSHRQADALAALRRARAVLTEELGIDPGPALRLLESEALAQSPSLDASAPSPSLSPFSSSALVGPPSAGPDDVVGRDRELAELRSCVAAAAAGLARVVCVKGPAGTGRSRLLAETRRLAGERGFLTLAARGSRLARENGWGVVRRLLGPMADVPPLPPEGPASKEPAPKERFAVLHGLHRSVVRLAAGRPLLIAVDDLQWCDTASLRFLAYLLPRVEGLPVLVAVAVRTEAPADDERLLAEVVGDPSALRVTLEPLGAEATGVLVRRLLGAPADSRFVAACHRAASGNPLLLRRLLRELKRAGVRPDAASVGTVTALAAQAVDDVVLMRLARLPAEAVAVARAIAVLGDGAQLPLLAALVDMSEQDVAAATARLVHAGAVRDGYPPAFASPGVADSVHRAIPAGERQLRHERAARLLAGAGAAPERVAAHLATASPLLHVVSVTIEAAGPMGSGCAMVASVSVRTDGAADGTLSLTWFHSLSSGQTGPSVATDTIPLPKGSTQVSGRYTHTFPTPDGCPYLGVQVSTSPAADSGNGSFRTVAAPSACDPIG